jgi:L-seryl-tRNA(Ser) seleniumtransferase
MTKPINPSAAKKEIHLPQVDKILREPVLEVLAQTVRREVIAAAVRLQLAKLRAAAFNGPANGISNGIANCDSSETPSTLPGADTTERADLIAETVAKSVEKQINTLLKGGIKRVINGTGVILSTNLGRAPLSAFSVKQLTETLSSYCNLEFDLDDGVRGERTEQLSLMLTLLTGSQSAIVVNNCAAAVMLAVQALAHGKEVIVSRGELIEIGGSFRLPDVIAASGGILKEVGTTNRTRLSDYKNAISAKTGLIIKCHRSNYQILGFTEEASAEELAALSKETKIPLAYDLGGGCLVDLSDYNLAPEPTVQATLAAGVSLVMFSGDKLLGGPQAGIIAGQLEYISQLRKCPVYRTLRADKVVLALLETVISQYIAVGGADNLPVFVFAALKREDLMERVHLFIGRVKGKLQALDVSAIEMTSTMGGGSLPGESLPSFGLALKAGTARSNDANQSSGSSESSEISEISETSEIRGIRETGKIRKRHENTAVSESRLAKLLRQADPPVISTISNGLVMLDFRTIKVEDEEDLASVLLAIDQSIK